MVYRLVWSSSWSSYTCEISRSVWCVSSLLSSHVSFICFLLLLRSSVVSFVVFFRLFPGPKISPLSFILFFLSLPFLSSAFFSFFSFLLVSSFSPFPPPSSSFCHGLCVSPFRCVLCFLCHWSCGKPLQDQDRNTLYPFRARIDRLFFLLWKSWMWGWMDGLCRFHVSILLSCLWHFCTKSCVVSSSGFRLHSWSWHCPIWKLPFYSSWWVMF